MRACKKCDLEKSDDQFAKAGMGRNGVYYLKGVCKKCDNGRRARLYYADPSRAYFYMVYRRYGITREAWLALFESQGRRCACCDRETPTQQPGKHRNGWQTEHDHNTGKVRGITCQDCNRMLGAARDSVEILQAGIRYLERARC